MVFASPLFLFAFLPLALACYYLTPNRARNLTLLCLSLAFYAWGEREWILVMLASITLNWMGAMLIDWLPEGRGRKWVLGSLVAVNLAGLAYFKYADFALENLNRALGVVGKPEVELLRLHLPLGISFFTFHAISYVVDVYRRQSRALKNPLDTALYFALFPQLIAGPIIRYHYIEEQLRRRRPTLADMAYGVQRFVWGLAKKVLVANVVARCADAIFSLEPAQLSLGLAWVGVIAYALQIYFDFSGYSDMAIGLAAMFGFRFPENFRFPYVARSVTEFWRRWHISLSSWFRDYVYIPLGGNRGSKVRTYANLVLVFFLCGLWHGASWNFIIWGALHGCFLVLERSAFGNVLTRMPRSLQHAYLLLVVCIGWVFFRSPDLTSSLAFLKAMTGASRLSNSSYPVMLFLTPSVMIASVLGFVFSAPVVETLTRRLEAAKLRGPTLFVWRSVSVSSMLAVFTLSAAYLATRTYNPFIYFRF